MLPFQNVFAQRMGMMPRGISFGHPLAHPTVPVDAAPAQFPGALNPPASFNQPAPIMPPIQGPIMLPQPASYLGGIPARNPLAVPSSPPDAAPVRNALAARMMLQR